LTIKWSFQKSGVILEIEDFSPDFFFDPLTIYKGQLIKIYKGQLIKIYKILFICIYKGQFIIIVTFSFKEGVTAYRPLPPKNLFNKKNDEIFNDIGWFTNEILSYFFLFIFNNARFVICSNRRPSPAAVKGG